ncbi:MAG: aspartate--ammonia ligase [Lachnospiraceae bacterium]|uniref:Aspartate--ammonia ligase n=1 Tax=Candidatus Weimeria bifida TaxID=2599074 RepID=A0A6N7J255_9FIRM|nr:aspartate--ammonia ligase [Candidatus Weimeria bifida]RRF96504.1 MAG: aspartate--ammonia ligase [Lachnospiraceae bacterium]
MSQIKIPEGYRSVLNLKETQIAIKQVKDFFQQQLSAELNLHRVTAPLFVAPESGLNDNLNGVERPVSFGIKEQNERKAEIVHSLAKWKRMALGRYGFTVGEGLYTDMNAIRRDEDTDNIHSIYVDQWDWEKVITHEDRNEKTLRDTVKSVYEALRITEKHMSNLYEYITCWLPEEITFVTSQELLDKWPDATQSEREYNAAKEHGAIFLEKIGGALSNGKPHDGRAPDYDDWNLNGDIIVYYPVNDIALELSSMGIRVDEVSLPKQLKAAGCEERLSLPFHKAIMEKKLPYTIGGGIGQSRICLLFLRKCHIGEVQVSLWPEEDRKTAREHGVILL